MEKLLIALHEAGHALIAFLLGHGIARVEITQGQNWHGETERVRVPDDDRESAMYFLAGVTAETILAAELGLQPRAGDDVLFAMQGDRTMADRFIGKITGVDPNMSAMTGAATIMRPFNQMKKQIEDEVARMILSNKNAVVKLARLLEEKEHLTGQEAEAALKGQENV